MKKLLIMSMLIVTAAYGQKLGQGIQGQALAEEDIPTYIDDSAGGYAEMFTFGDTGWGSNNGNGKKKAYRQ